jgi:hypothetical protein
MLKVELDILKMIFQIHYLMVDKLLIQIIMVDLEVVVAVVVHIQVVVVVVDILEVLVVMLIIFLLNNMAVEVEVVHIMVEVIR